MLLYTIADPNFLTVNQAARLARHVSLPEPKKLALLLASLCHDIGKPTTSRWEFKRGRMAITNNRHDVTGEHITTKLFERLKIFSWGGFDLKKIVPAMIRCHHRPSEIWQNRDIITKKAYNRLAADVFEIDTEKVKGSGEGIRHCVSRFRTFLNLSL